MVREGALTGSPRITTGQLALSARCKIVFSPVPRSVRLSRLRTIGSLTSKVPAGKMTSPPVAGSPSKAACISTPVAAAGKAIGIGLAGEVPAATRHQARKTNFTQPVMSFAVTGLLTSCKLVFIRPSLLRTIRVSVPNVVHSQKNFTIYFHIFENIFCAVIFEPESRFPTQPQLPLATHRNDMQLDDSELEKTFPCASSSAILALVIRDDAHTEANRNAR